ncbi:hypothetical protein V1477_003520 [Vespula maculifrons]|uniref:Uncharacterized protein n=1 Tax=Vespula maculifrons TaxID=7453 RepID=A0ABD2CT16_VESMC
MRISLKTDLFIGKNLQDHEFNWHTLITRRHHYHPLMNIAYDYLLKETDELATIDDVDLLTFFNVTKIYRNRDSFYSYTKTTDV